MFRKVLRTAGFALISMNTVLGPTVAFADNSDSVVGACIGAPIAGIITGAVLVSMSRTKHHATKADKYINSDLDMMRQYDNYLRTTTDKRKISND